MAIDFREFQKMGSSNAKNKILEFLNKEKDKAFEYRELAKLLKESERTVNAYLSILKNEGKVLHKQPYWAYNRDYSETSHKVREANVGKKVVPSMFRCEDNGIFSFIDDPTIKLDLNLPIKVVNAELAKHNLWSENIFGFYYLLRKRAGLLNKRIYEHQKVVDVDTKKDIKIKLIPTCFKYGVATLSTEDRKLFPQDRHPFLLEIDGKLKTKHVASLKIAMKDFFDRNSELEEKEYITIKVIKPFEEYRLAY